MHAHTASVRSVDTRGRYLASGGADDRIHIYDMRKRQEIQVHYHDEILCIVNRILQFIQTLNFRR